MSKSLKIASIIIITALGIFGIYATIGIRMLMNICYEIAKYKYKGIDIQYIYIDLQLRIFNPSILKVGLNGYNLNVYLNNKWLSDLTSYTPIIIKSEGISTITIPLKIDYLKTFGTIKSKEIINYFLTQQFDKIIITLKGKFSGTVLKIPVSVPVDSSWTLQEIAKTMDNPSEPCKLK